MPSLLLQILASLSPSHFLQLFFSVHVAPAAAINGQKPFLLYSPKSVWLETVMQHRIFIKNLEVTEGNITKKRRKTSNLIFFVGYACIREFSLVYPKYWGVFCKSFLLPSPFQVFQCFTYASRRQFHNVNYFVIQSNLALTLLYLLHLLCLLWNTFFKLFSKITCLCTMLWFLTHICVTATMISIHNGSTTRL